MWFLPYEHLLIKTKLSRGEIIKKLQDITDTSGKIIWFPAFFSDHKLYRGKITKEGFNIFRWINHRDSFIPIIYANFLAQNTGSTIRIRMHMHWSVMMFMTLWLGFFGLTLVNQILYVLGNISYSGNLSTNFTAALGFPSFFFLFGYGMMIITFKIDAKREKKFIREITEAYNVTELGIFDKDETQANNS